MTRSLSSTGTSIKLNNRAILAGLLAVFTLASLVTCGGLKGQFGFKRMVDEGYRKVSGVPELKRNETVEWAFAFENIDEPHSIGLFVMKKELVWVEVLKDTRNIVPGRSVVYGTIENYDEGRYRIILTEKENTIAEQEFVVYDSEEITE